MIRHSFAPAMSALFLALPAFGAADNAAMEEVVVTATKLGARDGQDVPRSIDVFSAADLHGVRAETLSDIGAKLANVQFEDAGTTRGIATFSIRGVGVNSSTASIDPAVGLFVDGLYLGMNAGALTDLFDTEAVEVLRGPQGALYGHNVTGGAILLRTRAPADAVGIETRVSIESGPQYSGEAAFNVPLIPGLMSARLALTGTRDEGWFTNRYDGKAFGRDSRYAARFGLRLTPTDDFDTVLRLEYGNEAGDGPATQNHALFARGSFDFAIDHPGYTRSHHAQATAESHWDVSFGAGQIANVAGWRGVEMAWAADIDSTPAFSFHSRILNSQSQFSDELRYAGRFGTVDVVAGLYAFEQHVRYIDERNFSPTFRRTGGGRGVFRDQAAFASADWHLGEAWTLSAGLRFTHESKFSRISRVRRAADDLDGAAVVPGEGLAGGDIDTRSLTYSDGPYLQSWNDLSPNLGLQWRPGADDDVYATWSKAFRGGGVNFRVSSLGIAPKAYQPERQSTVELGWKHRFATGFANLALFHNRISAMQRDTNLADPISGVQQVVLNAGTATIYGAEIETRWTLTPRLTVDAQAGYLHGGYDRISADLNGDLIVDAVDRHLKIPRLAPFSYGAGATYTHPLAQATATLGLSFHHRDATFYNDSNLGRLAGVDRLDARLDYAPDGGTWRLALTGKNLTDQAGWGGDTILPATAAYGYSGGARPTFSPLEKGRVIGLTLQTML